MRPDEIQRVQKHGHTIRCSKMEQYLDRVYQPLRTSIIEEVRAAAEAGSTANPTLQADAEALQAAIESTRMNKPDAIAERLFAGVTDPATHPLPTITPGFVTGKLPSASAATTKAAGGESVDSQIAALEAEQKKLVAEQIEAEKSKAERLRNELAALKAGGKVRAPAPSTPAATTTIPAKVSGPRLGLAISPAVQRHIDNREQAEREWGANFENCQSDFSSKANYVAYRKAVLDGTHRENRSPQVATVSK